MEIDFVHISVLGPVYLVTLMVMPYYVRLRASGNTKYSEEELEGFFDPYSTSRLTAFALCFVLQLLLLYAFGGAALFLFFFFFSADCIHQLVVYWRAADALDEPQPSESVD